MEQAAHIELQTGANRRYRQAVWAIWLLGAVCTWVFFSLLPWPILLLSTALLIVFWPGFSAFYPAEEPLRLYSDGSAVLSGRHCIWFPAERPSRWGLLLRLEVEGRSRFALVCASINQATDYRRLLVWNRFPPFGVRD